jgi:hypothetical protein
LEEVGERVALPPVEAELELAQVPLEVLARYGALVVAEHPPRAQASFVPNRFRNSGRLFGKSR